MGTAVFLRKRHADQAELAHLAEDLAIGLLLEIGLLHPRKQLLLRVLPGCIADHPLVFSELVIEEEWIVPLECNLVLGRRTRAHHAHGAAFPAYCSRFVSSAGNAS